MKQGINYCISLMLGIALLPALAAAQQESPANPSQDTDLILKPANTSSPRDTLRSFIENMEIVF